MLIGFYGLTHLGLSYLSASLYKGFKTIGYDKTSVLKKIKSKKYFKEPYIFEQIKKNKKKNIFTEKISDLNKCDIIFFSYDTPISFTGNPDINFIKKKINNLIKNLNKDKIIVILSQVDPGFTDKVKWDKNNLFYMVETLIFGDAFSRAAKPEKIIIGTKFKNYNFKKLVKYLKLFSKNIIITDYNSAEFTKICINIFLISCIFTSNHLAELAKNIGANWLDICKSLRLDKRIGKFAYLRPSIGLSGSNLIRDLNVIKNLAEKKSLPHELTRYWLKKSKDQSWTIKQFKKIYKKNKKYNSLILGLSYKENTDSILNSASINFLKTVENYSNCKFYCYDPVVNKFKSKNSVVINDISQFKFKKNSNNILFIMTPWKQFLSLSNDLIKKFDYIVDPYAMTMKKKFHIKNYICLM